ncbi:MAG TPA: DUF4214 domain-containing protein [Pirellulales bacterium]|nr:DUF4214 domain-containing protein [Pirellulales bacterium]
MSKFFTRHSFSGLSSIFSRRKRRTRSTARPARRRHALELLEDRSVMATLTVNNLSDAVSPGSGQVTLRQAIYASENHTATALGDVGTGNDTIVFAAGLAGTIDLSQIGDSSMDPTALAINHNDLLTIEGDNGGSGITIARDSSVANLRLFEVASGADLTLKSLTLADGQATGAAGNNSNPPGGGGGGGGAGLGGAIFNQGSLNLVQDTLTGNTALGGTGGGGSFGGFLAIGGAGGGPNGGAGGTSNGITAGDGGPGGFAGGGGGGGDGAEMNAGFGGQGGFGGGGGGMGTSMLPHTTTNASPGFGAGAGGTGDGILLPGAGGGGAGLGGAVFNEGGTLTITDSTLTGNAADGGQAGQTGFSLPSFAADNGGGFGGALFNHNGVVTLLNSTIANNTADLGAGGIYNLGDGQRAVLVLNNTIAAGNKVAATEADFTGGTTSAGGSVNTTSGVGNLLMQQTGFAGTIVSTQDHGLSALAANGGPTETMAIDSTSAAYHAGNAAAALGLATDQRGAPRLSTGNLIDIGSFQTSPAPSAEAGGPYQIHVGDSLHLDASASADPSGAALTYRWDVNGDGTFGDATGVSPTLTWSQLNALGINGSFSTANLAVEVSDGVNPPVVSAATSLDVIDAAVPTQGTGVAITGNELSALSNLPVATFQAAGGQPSPSQFSATINWGDGTSATANLIAVTGGVYTVAGSHTYADEGKYNVEVTANGTGGDSIVVSTTALIHEELLPGGTQGTANQQIVSELYRDLLGRQVDMAGLAHWTGMLGAGATRSLVEMEIEQTREYMTDAVQASYQQYLRRGADAGGLTHFVGMLSAGDTIEQVDQILLASAEYFQVRGGGTNDGFFDALFQDILNRSVDSATRTWFHTLASGGATRAELVSLIYGGLEHQQDMVKALYSRFLDRSGDTAGLNTFVAQLRSGQSPAVVAAEILASPEYLQKATH